MIFTGRVLLLRTLGQRDLLATKLWALCDRGTDLADCCALMPSPQDLTALRGWLHEQDLNPDWPGHVDALLAEVAKRCGHGV